MQNNENNKKPFVTPEEFVGGILGIVVYIIIKSVGGYGWHGGDILGMILLGFLPGAGVGSSLFNFKK